MIREKFGSRGALLKHFRYKAELLFGNNFGTNANLPMDVRRLVFVCKGNICRSVYAEAVANKLDRVPAASFGLDTTDGKSANERVCKMAHGAGLDLSGHRTTTYASFEAMPGDLFVCMEPAQGLSLRSLLPESDIVLLGLVGSPKFPYIHDPFNAGDEYLDQCMRLIDERVIRLVNTVTERVGVNAHE